MLTPEQKRRIRALELAFQGLARNRLVMVSVDDNLLVAVHDPGLQSEIDASSAASAILARHNSGHDGVISIKHHQVFLDGGAA